MRIRNMKQMTEHMKDMNMKRLFRRNQIIITTLAVMIAAAGYLNYAGKQELSSSNRVYEAGAMDISDEDILAENQAAAGEETGDILSMDQDISDLPVLESPDTPQISDGSEKLAESETDAAGQTQVADAGEASETGLENPGEAVLTSGMSVADYIANVQLSREQIRAKNRETLMNLINNENIEEAAKQQAISDMIKLTEISEKENAAETLLMAKGFADPVVSITDDKVDVVINAPSITDPQRAQIEDIVKRKTEVGADQIIITLLNMED